ncbi:MAG: MTH1187 family thiamine-binding protein [Candidatus Krumholzibacteriia bacterium]
MVLLEFSMYPTDKGESVSDYVKRSLEIIDDSGLPYKLGPMGTCVEGEIGEVLDLMRRCFERMSEDSNRIACVMKFDYRKGYSARLTSKVETVKRKTGRDLST